MRRESLMRKTGAAGSSPCPLSEKPRLKALSGVKILAVIGIIACHTGVLPQWDLCARMVEILFLLSGFCMAYNHYGDGFCGSFGEGWHIVRRKLPRFYPAHLATFLLQVFFVATWAAKPLSFILSFGALNLALLQAWFPKTQFMFNNVAWFLSALVFCYFVTPALAAAVKRAEERRRLGLMFLLLTAIRLYIEYMCNAFPREIWLNLHTNPLVQSLNYSLGFLAGAAFLRETTLNDILQKRLSAAWATLPEILFTGVYLAACYALAGVAYRLFFVLLGLPVIYIFAGGRGYVSRLISAKPAVWLAGYSLEIFMFHSFILYHYPVNPADGWYFVKFGAMVLAAAVGFRLLTGGIAAMWQRHSGSVATV